MPVQDLIGREFPPFEMPVERGKIREFAKALLDDNPIYTDPLYAKSSEFSRNLAPPTFAATKAFWRRAESLSELAGLDPRFRLHGEEEYEYYQPVSAGDVLTAYTKITDAYERTGKRGGKMTFIVLEYTFFNQKREKVLISRTTSIHTEGAVKK